jgi:Putative metallopeptidase
MKYVLSWAAAAVMPAAVMPIVWAVSGVAPACAQTPIPPNPQIEIAYVKPGNPALARIYEQMQSHKVLETLQVFLAPLKLPNGAKLIVKFDQCGGATSIAYQHAGPVTICYEYVAQIEQMVPRSTVTLVQGTVTPDAAVIGPVTQAALHEMALGVFDVMNLPVWGRTDDAADRLSAFIMVQFGPNVAWNTIVGTAWFLSGNVTRAADFSDIRGVVAQRYYTTLCIAYGGEARGVTLTKGTAGATGSGLGNFVGGAAAGNLPQSRAQSCPYEYDAIKQAFVNLFVAPGHVDQSLLGQVQKAFACTSTETDPFRLLACAPRQ